MLINKLMIITALAAPFVQAQDVSSYYSGSFSGGAISAQEQSWYRYSLGGGYFFNQYLALGADLSVTEFESANTTLSATGYLRGQRTLNSTTKAYLSVGLDTRAIKPQAHIGALFEIMPRTYLDVGYIAQMMHGSDIGQAISIGIYHEIHALKSNTITLLPSSINKTLNKSDEPEPFSYCFSMTQLDYQVKQGDTTESIRRQFNLTRADFTSANPKIERRATPDLLFTGETLIIPRIEIQRCH